VVIATDDERDRREAGLLSICFDDACAPEPRRKAMEPRRGPAAELPLEHLAVRAMTRTKRDDDGVRHLGRR